MRDLYSRYALRLRASEWLEVAQDHAAPRSQATGAEDWESLGGPVGSLERIACGTDEYHPCVGGADMRWKTTILAVALGAVFLAVAAVASAAPTIRLDHSSGATDFSTDLEVGVGEYFDVVLRHTTKSFTLRTYALRAAARSGRNLASMHELDPFTGLLSQAEAELVTDDSVVVAVAHRNEYGGYVVEVACDEAEVLSFTMGTGLSAEARSALASSFLDRANAADWTQTEGRDSARVVLKTVGEFKTLKPFKVFVRVRDHSYKPAQFSAGFCATWLTDERYKAEEDGDENILRRDRAAESDVRPLAVAFLHVTPSPRVPVGIALGLGVNGDSDLAFMPGLSLRVCNMLFLSAGAHIGAINSKPVGATVDEPLQDVSVLTKPDRIHKVRPYVALTYTFLGNPQEVFRKPFAEPEKK